LDTYFLAEACLEAGLPEGVLNVVAAHRDVSEELVRHRGVDMVTFTGSSATGRRIAAICGEQLKHAHMELGGKSAAIVLDDVELDDGTIPLLLGGGMLFNNGEACAAWTRILVPRIRHDEVVDAICAQLANVKVGDPFDPATEVGPLVAERQRTRVEGYIALAVEEGAKIIFGGGRPVGQNRGWFVEPTLLVNANNSMRSSREEIFGPVASVIPYDDVDEAIAIANDSEYGLSGAVLTSDSERGFEVAHRVRSGTIGVNAMTVDYAIPFGGYKESGLGRQNGPEGFDEFFEIKSITYR
jgi:betaine-aldehyde dehydrogenase